MHAWTYRNVEDVPSSSLDATATTGLLITDETVTVTSGDGGTQYDDTPVLLLSEQVEEMCEVWNHNDQIA